MFSVGQNNVETNKKQEAISLLLENRIKCSTNVGGKKQTKLI